jgi:hypothetical protein
MYSNYGERGDHFCAFVKEIIERELNYDQQR